MKTFVVFVRCHHQVERGLFHLLALLAHAAAVVDDQAQRNRHVFALEHDDGLRLAVFVNREGRFRQIGYQMAGLIDHRGGADDARVSRTETSPIAVVLRRLRLGQLRRGLGDVLLRPIAPRRPA